MDHEKNANGYAIKQIYKCEKHVVLRRNIRRSSGADSSRRQRQIVLIHHLHNSVSFTYYRFLLLPPTLKANETTQWAKQPWSGHKNSHRGTKIVAKAILAFGLA